MCHKITALSYRGGMGEARGLKAAERASPLASGIMLFTCLHARPYLWYLYFLFTRFNFNNVQFRYFQTLFNLLLGNYNTV